VFIRLLIQCAAHSANGFRVTGLLLACSFLFEPSWSLPCSAARASLVANYVSFRGDVRRASSTPRNLPDQENGKIPRLFGLDTEPVAWGTLLEKWHRVKAESAHDLEVVEQCRASGPCSVPAQKLIDLASEGASRSGRARVGLINRAVNFAITPVSDEAQWGVPDRWSGPLETLRSKRGDCEDYAILKYVALLEAGLSKADLKIVILKNRLPNEDHAAVAARADGQWLILDNRTLTLVRDMDVARAIPIFVLDDDGVRRFVRSTRDRRR
jgi:predicted transglutaminase-like cysteine proteinase